MLVMHRGTTGKGVFELQRRSPSGAYTGTYLIYSDGVGWRFHTANSDTSTGTTEAMLIDENGNVGIGTTDPGSWKLAVNGKIRAKEIKVETGWADYVFEKEYDLPTLEEVRRHIEQKGHLINIPSAKEVEENGIELGEMNKLLLQKIEELTLYILQMEDDKKELEKRLQLIEKNLLRSNNIKLSTPPTKSPK